MALALVTDGALTMASRLAREIRRRMEAGGFNQKSLARAAGLNQTAVRDILIGKSRHPRHDTLEKLAASLECSVIDLLEPGQGGRGQGSRGRPPGSPRQPVVP